MRRVPQPELSAGLLHQRRKGRVIDVAEAGEEVVPDLEVQPPNEPREQPTSTREIDGRFDLVYGPARLHPAGVLPGQGESGLLHAMRQLKHDAERQALNQRHREVEQRYGPQRVQEQREQQRQRREYLTGTMSSTQPRTKPRKLFLGRC